MKLIITVSTNKIGSTMEREIEVDDDDLAQMDDDQRADFLEACARDTMFEMIAWDFRIVD